MQKPSTQDSSLNVVVDPESRPLNGTEGRWHPDGTFNHDKPLDEPGQWLLRPSDTVPGVAFPMRAELTRRFVSLAKVHTTSAEGAEVVRRVGEQIFHSVWGEISLRFKAEELNARRTRERLETEHTTVSRKRDQLDPHIPSEPVPARLPQGLARVWFFLFVASILLLTLAGWTNAAALALPHLPTQSWPLALLYASPLLFAPLAVKIGLRLVFGRARLAIGWLVVVLGVAALAAFVGMMAHNFGRSATLDEISAGGILVPDLRVQFVAQVMLEFALGVALYVGAASLLLYPPTLVANADWNLLSQRLAALDPHISDASLAEARAAGHLHEFNASCEAWIQVGLGAHRLFADAAQQVRERQQLLEGL